MAAQGTTSSGEVIARLIESDNPEVIATFGAEPDLVKILQYPDAAVACDCEVNHPREAGTFPRVLGHYVRETSTLSLAEAVRKMTGLPASIIGMVDRGFIAAGMAADLTVFDAARVIDRATYERPRERSEGIRFVVVNGRIALANGEPTGIRAGQALRRTRAMPSRPMRLASSRTLRVDAGDAGRRITLDLAAGRLRIVEAGATLEGTAFGLIQTAPRWSSVTAIVRDTATGAERGAALIVDEALGSVTVQVDGRPALAWALLS
jgi:hypothetical protein